MSRPIVETLTIVRDDRGDLQRVILHASDGAEALLPVTEINLTASASDRQGHVTLGVHGHRVRFSEKEE